PAAVLADVDAVDVVTPADTHFELAHAALLAGKHVFVEKPLATSVRDGRKLVEIADERGLVLQVGHVFRYHPVTRVLLRLVRDGTLGRLQYLYGHFMGFKRM